MYSFCIMSEVDISVLINEIYKSLTFFYEFAIFNIQVAEGENRCADHKGAYASVGSTMKSENFTERL